MFELRSYLLCLLNTPLITERFFKQDRAVVAHLAHTQEVDGAIPSPATIREIAQLVRANV